MDEQPQNETVATEEQAEPKPAAPDLPPRTPSIHRYPSPEAVAKAAAKRFLETAKRAVAKNDRFTVVLGGGEDFKLLYNLLSEPPYREKVPWKKTFFVFSDERCAPPEDEASKYRMVQESLFAPLEIPEHRVLRMKGERPPERAAQLYEVRLSDLFLGKKKRSFDLVLLGIGADGRTASLFPGTAALEEQERWVVANHVPQIDSWRLTLTPKALKSTRRIIFLATGEDKARVVAEAYGGVEHDTPHPCELVAPYYARKEVLVDREAASKIPQEGDHLDPPNTS